MISPTHGKVNMDEIVSIIQKTVEKNPQDTYKVIVGTDSQNFADTKMVLVIALQRVGKGGIFFYEVQHIPKIVDVRTKLFLETQNSLDCANQLLDAFERLHEKTGFDYTQLSFGIHVDAGFHGKTTALIPEIVAWVNALGYGCVVKPDSFVASSIADRISK